MFTLVVLISGNGSNLQAIIDAIAAEKLNAKIVCVMSNRADAYGLERAQRAHIPTLVLNPKSYPTREAYDQALQTCIDQYQPNLIVLAGFMRILSPAFVTHFAGKILNIHPALLPNYPGLDTHTRVLADKQTTHGASVHIVTAELDGGPIIAQASLSVALDDTPATLKNRVHQLEHRLYPQVIQWFVTGELQWQAGKLWWQGKPLLQPLVT